MRKTQAILTFFLLVFCGVGLQAQVAVTTLGGDATGSGGSVAFSVGQLVYSTHAGASFSEAQGIQQPFEISEITGLKEAKGVTLQCSTYPVPTSDYLTLKIENYEPAEFVYQLYDLQGELIISKAIVGSETIIPVSHLAPSTYILKVKNNRKWIKSFKIIKN